MRDMSGMTVGRYRLIGPTEQREHGGVVWQCSCLRCGAERMLSVRQAERACCRLCLVRDGYALGILWALCSCSGDKHVVRCADEHYVRYIADITGGAVWTREDDGREQYVTVVPAAMMAAVVDMGWSGRWDTARSCPVTPDPWGFAAAYIQAHSTVDTTTTRKRDGSRHTRLRLRVYGSEAVLSAINDTIADAGLGKRKTVMTGRCATLYYQSTAEVQAIVEEILDGVHSDVFAAQVAQARDRLATTR